jgi:small subunit ribosomal protein S17
MGMDNGTRKIRRLKLGKVVSDKMEKTIVVEVERTFSDPRFHKIVRRHKKYKVHDESGVARPGDVVEFYEGKPVSKEKYMYLHRVVTQHVSG